MDTAEIMIFSGAGACAAALAILTYLLGAWRAEHRAAREYVDVLAERHALARQRAALEEQRAALGRQRVYLEEIDQRRRTPRLGDRFPNLEQTYPDVARMPDTGRARVDDEPTREIDVSAYRRAPLPRTEHMRRHRQETNMPTHGPRPAPYPAPRPRPDPDPRPRPEPHPNPDND